MHAMDDLRRNLGSHPEAWYLGRAFALGEDTLSFALQAKVAGKRGGGKGRDAKLRQGEAYHLLQQAVALTEDSREVQSAMGQLSFDADVWWVAQPCAFTPIGQDEPGCVYPNASDALPERDQDPDKWLRTHRDCSKVRSSVRRKHVYWRAEFTLRGRLHKLLLHRVLCAMKHNPVECGGLTCTANVIHTCEHAGCVAPWHLRFGTDSENRRRAHAKKRRQRYS